MNKPWYYRLLLSYLPVFLIITFLLLTVAILSIHQLSKQAAEEANEATASHAMALLDQSLKAVDEAIVKEIHANPVLDQFLSPAPEHSTFQTLYEPSSLLRDLVNNIQSIPIHSITLYRSSDKSVLTPNSLLPLEKSGDRAFLESVVREEKTRLWSERRSYKEFINQEQPVSVISLVRKIPLLSGGQGFILVHIKTNHISSLVHSIFSSDSHSVSLYDFNGTSLLDSSTLSLDQVSEENQELGSWLRSAYTGWSIRSELVDMRSFERITQLSKWPLLAGGTAILLGSFFMLVMTRLNYKPLASILDQLQGAATFKSKEVWPTTGKDEFAFITTAFDKLMEQSDHYQERQKEDLIFRRQYFLAELLEGNRQLDQTEYRKELAGLGITGNFTALQLMILEIDHYPKFSGQYSRQDQALLKFVISSAAVEVAASSETTVWAEWLEPGRLTLLCHIMDSAPPGNRTALPFDHQSLLKWIIGHLDFTVTLGAGPQINELRELPSSYSKALEAISYKPVFGVGCLIAYPLVDSMPRGETLAYLQSVRSLAQTYRAGDEAWIDQFNALCTELKSCLFTREEIVHLFHYVKFQIKKELSELPAEFHNLWKQEAEQALNEALDNMDTLDQLYDGYFPVLLQTAYSIRQMRDKRAHHSLIHNIRAYIEAHYANPDLSLNHLSDKFDVNAKYISQLFKNECGEKFVDYLAQVRINHARKLLIDTGEPVQTIAEKVGYTHSFSFIRVFKKTVGLTPGDYRKEIR